MVKLPSFDNERTIDTGGSFARPVSPINDTAQAGQRLASSLGSLASALSDRAEKAEAVVKRQEAIGVESDLLDLKLTLDNDLREAVDNQSATGSDIYEPFAKKAADETQRVLSKYRTSEKAAEYELHAKRLVTGYLDKAGDAAYAAQTKAVGDITTRKTADLAATVAADPTSFDGAKEEINRYVDGLALSPNAAARFKLRMTYDVEKAALISRAEKDPDAVVKLVGDNFKGGPAKSAHPVARVVVEAANRYGVNPTLMLAVANLESRLDNKTVPILKGESKPVSSAKGIFQMIDADARRLGVDPTDNEAASDAMAKVFKKNMNVIEAHGHAVTPGKFWASHFLGLGAFKAVLTSSPDTPIRSALGKVWSQDFIDQAVRGNPAVFGKGGNDVRTVGDFFNKVEGLMGGHVRKVSGLVNGADAVLADDGKAVASQLLGRPAEAVTFADVQSIVEASRAAIKKRDANKPDLALAQTFVSGVSQFDPKDAESRKAVDCWYIQSGLAARFSDGDARAMDEVATVAAKLNYLPSALVSNVQAAMLKGSDDQKVTAYSAFAALIEKNPLSVELSKVPENVESRVKQFRTLTSTGLSPIDAIKRIDELQKPEFKAKIDGLKNDGGAGRSSTLSKWRKDRTFAELVDNDGEFFFDPDAATEGQKLAMTETYRDLFELRVTEYGDEKTAAAAARKDMARIHGVSELFGTRRFTAYPPEKFTLAVGGSVEYVKNQAVAAVTDARGGKPVDAKNIFLLPTTETRNDVEAKSGAPRYRLVYRDEKGFLQALPEMFRPNPQKEIERLRIEQAKEPTAAQREAAFINDVTEDREVRRNMAVDATVLPPSP